ncbi:MAG: hypothetical protein U0U67_13875 [Chitinophagales bacterium]
MQKKILYKTEPKIFEQKIERKYKNYRWILYCSITGMSFMFLSLTFSYFVSTYNTAYQPLKLVPLFYWNTLILLASSYAIYYAQQQYNKDNYTKYKTSLLAIVGFALLFISGQIIAWMLQFMNGYTLQHTTSKYLYVISGIHLIHIIGGLIFLAYFVSNSWTNLKQYATSVVYFTDPVAKSQLRLFATFWHFLGVVWLYLLIFFLIIG